MPDVRGSGFALHCRGAEVQRCRVQRCRVVDVQRCRVAEMQSAEVQNAEVQVWLWLDTGVPPGTHAGCWIPCGKPCSLCPQRGSNEAFCTPQLQPHRGLRKHKAERLQREKEQ